MKIRYSKRRLFSNLLLGSLFAILGALKWFEGEADYFNYFQLVLGCLMVGTPFFEHHNQYLKIENGILTKNSLRKKTIQLDEVIEIQSFPGRIKLFTSVKNLSINTSIIDDDSIQDLYPVLGSLELDAQENPFIGYARNTI